MAKYSIIADIGKGIVNMLRDQLVPEPIDKPEYIGICEPRSRGGYVVGIHPYDIKEDLTGQNQEPKTLADGSIQDPPALLELYYMISVSSKAEMDTKATDEARIIGKIIQVMNDNTQIPDRYMPQTTEYPREIVPISSLPLEMEEKVKVWTMFGESYKLSVFYVIGPIAIDSQKIRKPTRRVETVILNGTQFIPKKIVQFETRIKEEEIDDEYTQHEEEEGGDEGEGEDGMGGGDEDFGGGDEDLGGDDAGGDDGGDVDFGGDGGDGGDEAFGADDAGGDVDFGDGGGDNAGDVDFGGDGGGDDGGDVDFGGDDAADDDFGEDV